MSATVVIGRPIGPGRSPFIVAELSANHLGQLSRAHAIIDAAEQVTARSGLANVSLQAIAEQAGVGTAA